MSTGSSKFEATLDEKILNFPVKLLAGDSYSFGGIGQHNVVVVHDPGTSMSPARVVPRLIRDFPSTRLALVVGAAGGAPELVSMVM